MKKAALNRALFTENVFPPENPRQMMFVSIYADGRFSMNEALKKNLGGKSLQIAFTEDRQHFMIEEGDHADRRIYFPKSGSKKLDLTAFLEKRHIHLPAKYEVWKTEDGFWQGDLCENPTQSQLGKRRSSKKN